MLVASVSASNVTAANWSESVLGAKASSRVDPPPCEWILPVDFALLLSPLPIVEQGNNGDHAG